MVSSHDEPPSSSAGTSTSVHRLRAQAKWGTAPPSTSLDCNLGEGRTAPAVQEYGEPVQARLQQRLEDPKWQFDHAARTDKRLAVSKKSKGR